MFILTIFHYTVSLKYIHIVLWLLPPNISRTFPFSQIETLYPSTHPYPTPGNYHSKFFLNELDYLRYVIWVEPYSICHFVTCLFQLTSSSFLHVIARVRISSLRCDSIPLYVENTFFFFFFENTFSLSVDGHLGSFHLSAIVNHLYSYDSHSISYFTTFSLIFLI